MRSPKGLKRVGIALTLLGLLHLALSVTTWKLLWKSLPQEASFAALFGYVATGLWIAGSGLLLGMLGESADAEARWPGPLARGIASLLVLGGLASMALRWSEPESWFLVALGVLARWFARKPATAPLEG